MLAGWMHVLSPAFLEPLRPRAQPAPGAARTFPGTHVIRHAYEAAQRGEIDQTGVMVH